MGEAGEAKSSIGHHNLLKSVQGYSGTTGSMRSCVFVLLDIPIDPHHSLEPKASLSIEGHIVLFDVCGSIWSIHLPFFGGNPIHSYHGSDYLVS